VRQARRALDRIAEGKYGRCRECGEAIAPARLEAMPAAERCAGCA
jgi:RNA polymerase-binding transcription factor DksA